MTARPALTLDRKLGPLAGVLVILLSGCGTGEYEGRMEKRVTELRQVAKFNALYAPVPLEGTPILVRVPQTFKTQLVVGTMVEEKLVDARRAGIPFLRLGGLYQRWRLPPRGSKRWLASQPCEGGPCGPSGCMSAGEDPHRVGSVPPFFQC